MREYCINNKKKVLISNIAQDHIQYLVINLLIPSTENYQLFLNDTLFLKNYLELKIGYMVINTSEREMREWTPKNMTIPKKVGMTHWTGKQS